MPDTSAKSSQFWETVSEHVTAKVERARNQKGDERTAVIVYLRDLEVVARRECQCRDTIQIIASGRHLLGDHDELLLTDPPRTRSRRAFAAGNARPRNSHSELNLRE